MTFPYYHDNLAKIGSKIAPNIKLGVKKSPKSASDLGRYLASVGVGTRMLFGGNLLKQPAFVQLRSERPEALRLVEAEMPGADLMMQRALFLGTFPGLTEAMIDQEIALVKQFVAEFAALPL